MLFSLIQLHLVLLKLILKQNIKCTINIKLHLLMTLLRNILIVTKKCYVMYLLLMLLLILS